MTTLSTRTTTFRLHDESTTDRLLWCEVTILIHKKMYNSGKQIYDISYTFSYNEESHTCYNINPLTKEQQSGEIIAVNGLSEILCDYLIMDINELEKYSGSVSGESYKKSLMVMVTHLWD